MIICYIKKEPKLGSLNYFLNIPKDFPTGKNTLPKCLFKTAAPHP